MPDNNPMADMLSQWKTVSDAFIAQWGKAFEQTVADPNTEAATQEGQRTYLGVRAAMAEAARNAYGPVIEAVGAVPLTEFQRLADQMQTVLLRLDHIDDQLLEIRARQDREPKVAKPKGKGKKRAE